MPPQPGMFAVPSKSRVNVNDYSDHYYAANHHPSSSSSAAGPSSSRAHAGLNSEDPRKDKRKREFAQKLEKELMDKRGDSNAASQNLNALHHTSRLLSSRPDTVPAFVLRVYPLSLERSALLAQHIIEERNSLETVQTMYDLERERVEEEYKRGRERIRERMLEGIEEKRRRAREEKDGEGAGGDASLDSQTRSHVTRKLRNKYGTSPPPSPHPTNLTSLTNGTGAPSTTTSTTPTTNPHSLSVDELPSVFPLPLTAVTLPQSASGGGSGGGGGGGGGSSANRRRNKGGGMQEKGFGVLGKSGVGLASCKETEIDSDLGEITRGNKRRRAAAGALAGKA